MTLPSWLDARFFENILQTTEEDHSIRVEGVSAKPATSKGANYMSIMHRVVLDFSRIRNGQSKTDASSVIVKLELEEGFMRGLIREIGIFEREMSMMMETLPRMNEIAAELGVTLSARCFQVQKKYPMYIIIEDLAPRGFQMAQHEGGLDLRHSRLAIRNIAIFHAASIAVIEGEHAEMRTKYRSTKNEGSHKAFGALINKGTKALGREVVTWSELSPRISEKISKLAEVTWKKTCEAALVLEDDFNVLNHGDCSLKNMLFRYDEERNPVEQIFVDFQASSYGSPVIDILHFFGSSLSVDVRFEHRELLIREYHESLINTMAKIKCRTKAPSLENLHDSLKTRAFLEFYPSSVTLAHTFVDADTAKSSEQVLIELNGESGLPAHQNKHYRNIMMRVLPFFDSMGLLDV